MELFPNFFSFNSRPHKEVDFSVNIKQSGQRLFQFTTSQGGRPHPVLSCKNMSIFQFTTSQGGRLDFLRGCCAVAHDFQFTTSQGGRRHRTQVLALLQSFNSRPHKEVDDNSEDVEEDEPLSIHDLTRRSTTLTSSPLDKYLASQFTTSQGGRPRTQTFFLFHNPFQFTTSQGGRRCDHNTLRSSSVFQFTNSQGG